MKSIEEILDSSRPIDDIITDLKQKTVFVRSWSECVKEYEPIFHNIVHDKQKRKDKFREDGTVEPAARITIGMEKLLARRINEFTFSIPVKRKYTNVGGDEVKKSIQNAIEKIYRYSRIDSENLKRGLSYYAGCEFFTIWYTVKKPKAHSLYGFPCQYKLKCKTYSPMEGVLLYPIFDDLGDLILMSFEYTRKVYNETWYFFETYTADKHYRWEKKGDNKWEVVMDGEEISIMKIPGIYASRQFPIWQDLCIIREDLEYKISENSDVIAYNAAPVLKVSGGIQGVEDKGETRRIVRTENGGDVSYVSWNQSKEATEYHIESLLKMYFMLAQMPDLSFENLKNLGNIGFDARKTLMTDAHLKVGDEKGVWLEVLDREVNVIKAFLKEMNKAWEAEIDNVDVENIITPFVQDDQKLEIEKWSKFCGDKAVGSQLTAIKNLGLAENPEEEVEQIRKEEEIVITRKEANQSNKGNGSFEEEEGVVEVAE